MAVAIEPRAPKGVRPRPLARMEDENNGPFVLGSAGYYPSRSYGRFETRICAECGATSWYAREFFPDGYINLGQPDDEPSLSRCPDCQHDELWFIGRVLQGGDEGHTLLLGRPTLYLFVCQRCDHAAWRWRTINLGAVTPSMWRGPAHAGPRAPTRSTGYGERDDRSRLPCARGDGSSDPSGSSLSRYARNAPSSAGPRTRCRLSTQILSVGCVSSRFPRPPADRIDCRRWRLARTNDWSDQGSARAGERGYTSSLRAAKRSLAFRACRGGTRAGLGPLAHGVDALLHGHGQRHDLAREAQASPRCVSSRSASKAS